MYFQRRNSTEDKNSSFENFDRIDSFESGLKDKGMPVQ
jgi:hypothetical protein